MAAPKSTTGARRVRPLALAVVLVSGVALAYVLPAGAILRRMIDERDQQQLFTLRVDGSVSFFGETAQQAASALAVAAERNELQLDASVMLKLPGRCRFELTTPDGVKSAAVLNAKGQRGEGNAIAILEQVLPDVCSTLAVRSGENAEGRAVVERHLRGRGVDVTASTSLARFGGEVAYVLGKAGPDAPQFWVYKDSFLPARVRYKDAAGVAWDVRLLDYTSPATGGWFPRTIEVGRNQELALRFTALKGDARVKLDDQLF